MSEAAVSTRLVMANHTRTWWYNTSPLRGDKGEVWVLTWGDVEVQDAFLRAHQVLGPAAVRPRHAGRRVPDVDGASDWVCGEGFLLFI